VARNVEVLGDVRDRVPGPVDAKGDEMRGVRDFDLAVED
jgi:hypothetical protein